MVMTKQRIVGRTIDLRDVTASDASFVFSLRRDPLRRTYLSETPDDLHAQLIWIERYRAERRQFYFIIEDKRGAPLGTIRVYDLQPDSFCWGSWILRPGAPPKAALESALLVYEFGFRELGLKRSHFDVRKENRRVVEFHKRFGAKIVRENDLDYFFTFSVHDYMSIRPKYVGFLPESAAAITEFAGTATLTASSHS
ncbi:N-acetyltransferase [Oxalobacteraceae bacterium OM1]|nr:N-acetyltransferase [Oxalobacteraceae bacterium OM1]